MQILRNQLLIIKLEYHSLSSFVVENKKNIYEIKVEHANQNY